ncbi:AMP-binding enzyme family protein (macronuclear) [Tetrahymena thermophila SB210]|uniref:AMP-binding enzyme family protein n=1 Tax=Tetrahymena thermophila (strain SB210) TaxID=312017 RepID=I7M2H2_TETTS|nr:AMP-binding enzyme family protein [Tetrahymena thermophila SB210]EAS00383.2 AMP-binding enzyme family protein [Tetrahymena thermophila SB210]|eukprot:XP_001020628.2 AMP-binding enzyme family protein [Tetrahymena thermophila SB210]
MIYSKLDLFTSQFQFNVDNQSNKKGTLIGTIISFMVITTSLAYFIYILRLYLINQIEPSYRSQSFISNDNIEIQLNNDFVGFKFDTANIKMDESKTYLVYMAFYIERTQNSYKYIPLNVKSCTNANLLGYNCLDFSQLENQTLSFNSKENTLSQIQILTYGCLDIDLVKTTIPNNCASQAEIDALINGINAVLTYKLYTTQYNTTSQEIQPNYRTQQVYTASYQQIITQIKAQKQTTSIKDGYIIQGETSFSSPYQYFSQNSVIDRQYALQVIGSGSYNVAAVSLDEVIYEIQIQFQTLPQIFALSNSIFTLLMTLGIIGRFASQNSINKDFFMIFFKTFYQGSYFKLINLNNLFGNKIENSNIQTNIEKQQQNSQIVPEKKSQNEVSLHIEMENEILASNIFVPQFSNNMKFNLDNAKNNKIQKKNSQIQSNICDLEKVKEGNSSQKKQILEQGDENIQTPKIQEALLSQEPQYSNNIENGLLQSNQNEQIKDSHNNLQSQNILNGQQALNKEGKSQFSSLQLQKNQESKQIEKYKNSCGEKLQIIQNQNISNRLQKIIFDISLWCTKKKQSQINRQNKQVLMKVEKLIAKELNIYNLFKDIMFLKKAIFLILTQDQLAALQLVSCSQNFLDLDINKLDQNLNSLEQNLNHLELQILTQDYEKYQQQYFQQFLQRCTTSQNMSQLDERIFDTLNRSNIN